MVENSIASPVVHDGVMISGTFDDLEAHRIKLIEALGRERFYVEAMENYVVKPDDDVISSSLAMVERFQMGLESYQFVR